MKYRVERVSNSFTLLSSVLLKLSWKITRGDEHARKRSRWITLRSVWKLHMDHTLAVGSVVKGQKGQKKSVQLSILERPGMLS